jgi:exopolysaccharide biosynthesis predicted pyruvyltransferase EpsI
MPRFNRMATFATACTALIVFSFLYTTDRADGIRNTFHRNSAARKPRPCFGAIEAGRDTLYEVYSKSLAGVTHVAVCDWPWHHNSGDSAIWLGEMALLESLGKKVAYICGLDDCVKEDMDKALEGVPNAQTAVLMHGGGNFGDLWTSHQNLRNRLVQEMPDRKIRHFPQTFEFELEKPSSLLKKTMEVYAKHPDIEVVARDTESHAAMTEAFPTLPVRLTPDAAFYIGYNQASSLTPPIMRAPGTDKSILGLTGKHAAVFDSAPSPYDDASVTERSPFGWPLMSFEAPTEHDVLVLARYDKEGGQDRQDPSNWIPPLAPRTVRITDWDDAWRGIKQPPRANYGMIEADGKTVSFEVYWNQAALLRVQWALAKLSSGRFVISDRLHTEILATLLGLGHVAVEDGHLRKMEKVIDTWLAPCLVPFTSMDAIAAGAPRDTDANTVFVHSNEEAVDAAKAWLEAEDRGIRWSRVSE